MPMRSSRLPITAAAGLAALALAGCGPAATAAGTPSGGTAGAVSSAPAAVGSAASSAAARASAPVPAPKSAAASSQPAGGPVPRGFAAESVTWVSASEGFVLGTAPCAKAPCTSVLRTTDRGAAWKGLPAPVVSLGSVHESTGTEVWGIRFASPSHGFVFGSGLWETVSGGEHWAHVTGPAGRVVSLEISDGEVLAVTQSCSATGSCGTNGTLYRRALSGGPWRKWGAVNAAPIATGYGVAAMLTGTHVLTTGNGGESVDANSVPCVNPGTDAAAAVAVTGPESLALLCAGGAAAGSVAKTVYVSSDGGSQWTKEGSPGSGGDPYGISGGTAARLVVAADSGASWLYDSADGGRTWGTAYEKGDGGMGFNDLGFTNPSEGSVIYAPVANDSNSLHDPGQLLLTANGGTTWKPVTW